MSQPSASSPKATGGAGTHLESRVGAYYLAVLLARSAVRGLQDANAEEVRFQRAFEGAPLDDVIIIARQPAGRATLSLQAKRQLTFSMNDLFLEVIQQAWDTFSRDDFTRERDRLGVVVGVASSRQEDHYQSVLTWARYSASAADFLLRVSQPGLIHNDARAFLNTVRSGLDTAAKRPVSDEELWKFLQCFEILHFDFERGEASRDAIHAIDLARSALQPEEAGRARDLWQNLIDEVDNAKPTAGSLTRAVLIVHLGGRFMLGMERNLLPDLERVGRESQRALKDIGLTVGGTHLNRAAMLDEVKERLSTVDLLLLVGAPGVGKSATLRSLAQEKCLQGAVLVLKHDRLAREPGWAGQASLWGLSHDLDELMRELSCVPEPTLFLDGIDRLSDPSAWAIINDVFRCLLREDGSPRLKVIATARDTSEGYLGEIDPVILARLRLGRVQVPPLGDEEIGILKKAHPVLTKLLGSGGRAEEFAKRPYLLQRLLQYGASAREGHRPISEIDLMQVIWSDPAGVGGAMLRRRQDVLAALGRRRLESMGRPIPSNALDPEALESLTQDATLREDITHRTVTFTHDILEDWVLCWILSRESEKVADFIKAQGEPLALAEPLRLLAAWLMETSGLAEWRRLLERVSETGLQPRWRRAVLSAPLYSARALELLSRMEPLLLEHEGRLLGEMLSVLRTVETIPNPLALNTQLLPEMSNEARIALAHQLALPRPETWIPFLHWLSPKLNILPATLIEELSLVAETWQRWAANHALPPSRALVRYVARQLGLGEGSVPESRWRNPRAMGERLGEILLSSPADAPDEVRAFLRRLATEGAHNEIEFVLTRSVPLAKHLPEDLVSFLLEVMCPPEKEPMYWGSDYAGQLNVPMSYIRNAGTSQRYRRE